MRAAMLTKGNYEGVSLSDTAARVYGRVRMHPRRRTFRMAHIISFSRWVKNQSHHKKIIV